MGTGKKEASRKVRQNKVSDGMANVKVKGENFYRYVRDFNHNLLAYCVLKAYVANFVYQICQESQNLENVPGWEGPT